jgi:hypothetical protein
MTKRIYSLDPVQNAELAAQHAFEARATGVSVDTYWGEDSHREHDGQWGDEFGDLEDQPFEYSVTIRPSQESEGTIVVIVDAYDEDEAIEKVKAIYEDHYPVVVSVEVTG